MLELLNALLPYILTALPGIFVGLFALWRNKVHADGVQDWKDEVVEAIDTLAGKVVETKPTAK